MHGSPPLPNGDVIHKDVVSPSQLEATQSQGRVIRLDTSPPLRYTEFLLWARLHSARPEHSNVMGDPTNIKVWAPYILCRNGMTRVQIGK